MAEIWVGHYCRLFTNAILCRSIISVVDDSVLIFSAKNFERHSVCNSHTDRLCPIVRYFKQHTPTATYRTPGLVIFLGYFLRLISVVVAIVLVVPAARCSLQPAACSLQPACCMLRGAWCMLQSACSRCRCRCRCRCSCMELHAWSCMHACSRQQQAGGGMQQHAA